MPRPRTIALTVITLLLFGLLLVNQVQQPGISVSLTDVSLTGDLITPTLPALYEVRTPTPIATITDLPKTHTGPSDPTDSHPTLTPASDTLASPAATATVTPVMVNGVPAEVFIVLPEDVLVSLREIFQQGQQQGRNPQAFSKLGDSTIENPQFMTRFDDTEFSYDLADFAYLQPAIDFYSGSFGRQGAAVRRGLHTWSVFDPMWASNPACMSGETMLECEFRIWNPSLLFVRMGSNDAGIPNEVDRNLRRIVEFSIENGVIPVLGTKADRFEGSNINNQIIRQIAADYAVPLWDFDLIAGTIPGRGLGSDRVHMTYFFEHDYKDPRAYRTGNGIHTLTGLIMLDAIMHHIRDLIPPARPESTVQLR